MPKLLAIPLAVVFTVTMSVSPASAVTKFCKRADFAQYHNGHYDSWDFLRPHYDDQHLGHTHAWWNKTHDYYRVQRPCPDDW
jgi:hypothetical protein